MQEQAKLVGLGRMAGGAVGGEVVLPAERDRAKKARNEKKLQRQQERAATRADDGTPEPTAENEPRET